MVNLSGHKLSNTSVPRRSLEHLVSRRELRCQKKCDGHIKPEDSLTSTGKLNSYMNPGYWARYWLL